MAKRGHPPAPTKPKVDLEALLARARCCRLIRDRGHGRAHRFRVDPAHYLADELHLASRELVAFLDLEDEIDARVLGVDGFRYDADVVIAALAIKLARSIHGPSPPVRVRSRLARAAASRGPSSRAPNGSRS